MNLFRETYFNRRNWILEQLEELDLNAHEMLLVLLIDYMNEFGKSIDIDTLSKKMKLSCEEVDALLSSLMDKDYIKVEFVNRRIYYNLQGLFLQTKEGKPHESNAYSSLFSLYEQEFGRPLTQQESVRLSEWMERYELKLIEYALREAVVYEKMSFDYIDRILLTWKEKHITAAMYEEGKGL